MNSKTFYQGREGPLTQTPDEHKLREWVDVSVTEGMPSLVISSKINRGINFSYYQMYVIFFLLKQVLFTVSPEREKERSKVLTCQKCFFVSSVPGIQQGILYFLILSLPNYMFILSQYLHCLFLSNFIVQQSSKGRKEIIWSLAETPQIQLAY